MKRFIKITFRVCVSLLVVCLLLLSYFSLKAAAIYRAELIGTYNQCVNQLYAQEFGLGL